MFYPELTLERKFSGGNPGSCVVYISRDDRPDLLSWCLESSRLPQAVAILLDITESGIFAKPIRIGGAQYWELMSVNDQVPGMTAEWISYIIEEQIIDNNLLPHPANTDGRTAS